MFYKARSLRRTVSKMVQSGCVLMMLNIVLVLVLFLNAAQCRNTSYGYLETDFSRFRSRENRFINFNVDSGDVTVELAFNVPFITLPVKRSLDLTKKALVSVNLGALALGGAVVFSFAIFLPSLLSLLFEKISFSPPTLGLGSTSTNRYRKAGPDEEAGDNNAKLPQQELWKYFTLIEETLTRNNMDVASCVQKLICWGVRESSENVGRGRGSSVEKIIDGVVSSGWLNAPLGGTPVFEALNYGIGRGDCTQKYVKCKLNQNSIEMTMNMLKSVVNF